MSDFQPLDFSSYNHQRQSPFFSVLPPEIRHYIYTYVLSEYEDSKRPYSKDTYWWRPGDTAALRSSTELLRTCRRIYKEAWLLLFTLVEHRFYLTNGNRSPGESWPRGFRECNRIIHETHGKHLPSGRLGSGRIRVFAQLWMLEPGHALQEILDVPHFHPRHIAVTIRYTDFWHWEDCAPLHVDATWVNRIRPPGSVTHFTVEFEMLERRKDEVNLITNDAAEKWFFERRDGAILTARKEDMSVSTWTGSSVLSHDRWVRDEVRPGQLDYHVVTVAWKLQQTDSRTRRPCPNLDLPRDFTLSTPPFREADSIGLHYLSLAKVGLDTPAPEAWQAVQPYYPPLHDGSDSETGSELDPEFESEPNSESNSQSDSDSDIE